MSGADYEGVSEGHGLEGRGLGGVAYKWSGLGSAL